MALAPARRRDRDRREKQRPTAFWVFSAPIVPVIKLLTKTEIEGAENLPDTGPYIVVVNHYSEIDPLVVAVAVWRLGRAPRFLAKESLFRVPLLGWAMRSTGMIPVARSASSATAKQTIQTAQKLVEDGAGIIVYPEGTLTRDPDMWPMRGKTGAARLALADPDIPLIPAAQWGVQEVMPRYGKLRLFPWRKRVRLVFGPPLTLKAKASDGTATSVQAAATAEIMDAITELLATLRGETPPAERWNPSTHGQRETGRFEPEN